MPASEGRYSIAELALGKASWVGGAHAQLDMARRPFLVSRLLGTSPAKAATD